MQRVFLLNRYFFPDQSATSQMLTDVAFHLAAGGIETHVVTSQQLYEDPDARLPSEEKVRDVYVHRVSATRFGRSSLWGRGIDYLSYYFSTCLVLRATATRGDIVVAMTDPPLISLFTMPVIRLQGAHLVNWLQDVYPETAMRLKVPLVSGPIGQIISLLRDQTLKAARANIVVGRQMMTHILSHRVPPDSLHLIHNWADDEAIQPISHSDNPLRYQWQLGNKFVVGYSGNLGRAHEFDTILGAAQRLRGHTHIVFICIGGGHGFHDIRREIEQENLHDTFRFFPYQDRSMLKYSLGVADVHWISLKPQLEGLIVPSKFYGIAAAGRPIIMISVETGELAQLVKEHGCGIVVKPGDADALARGIMDLADNQERVAEMGRRARCMLERHFLQRHALETWRTVLRRLPARGQET